MHLVERRMMFGRDEVADLVDAYEELVFQVGQIYYNQQEEDIQAATKEVERLLKSMDMER